MSDCADWRTLTMAEREERFRALCAQLYPGTGRAQQAQTAAILAAISRQELELNIQQRLWYDDKGLNLERSPFVSDPRGPWHGVQPPCFRVGVILDNYMPPGDFSRGILNPAIMNTKYAQFALSCGAVTAAPDGFHRGEYLPIGKCNALFEHILLDDKVAVVGLRQFSIGPFGHFLGAGMRLSGVPKGKRPMGLPPEYDTPASVKQFYIDAARDAKAVLKPLDWIEGRVFNTTVGRIFDDDWMATALSLCHTGGDKSRGMAYWKLIRGNAIRMYNAWK